MSKQTGLLRMKGRLGGLSFYKSGNVDIVRVANGPSKERIASEPNFARTRENNAEFGGCSTVVKALRHAIGEARQPKGSAGSVIQRLMPIIKRINLNGIGARGQRSIELLANGALLEGFELHEPNAFASVFCAPFSMAAGAGRNAASITVPSFLPSAFVSAPGGATHFEVFSILCTLSDYQYDAIAGRYVPSDAALNMLRAEAASAVTSLSATGAVAFTLNPVLAGAPALTGSVAAVLLMGVVFYQRVGVVDCLLLQGNCLRVVGVF
ncbi:hypothetical protein BH11BAC7_BH11BAC7_28520 [soil metagenome]